jgi:hypothetical protein
MTDQESFIAEVFDDILTEYKDKLLPEKEEEKSVDFSDTFDMLQIDSRDI